MYDGLCMLQTNAVRIPIFPNGKKPVGLRFCLLVLKCIIINCFLWNEASSAYTRRNNDGKEKGENE